MKKHKELTPRDRKFVDAYLFSGNASEAIREAGCTSKHASQLAAKLLRKKNVSKLVQKGIEKMEKDYGMSFDWKMKKIKMTIEKSLPDVGDAILKPEVGLEAIKIANKMQGHESAEKHVSLSVTVDTDVQRANELMNSLLDKYKKEY